MSYRVSTQVYSGPFDLLLQLVTRQKVDIGAISISEVAEQYLAEVERISDDAAGLAERLHAVDGVTGTDGLAAMGGRVSDIFPEGLVVVQDDVNDVGTQNFKYIDWRDIKRALGL